ncbi:hypothetical protein PEC301296_17620 [Pectobacterium carotovorum subsp. carotovorum]|nr:hypothetical protein GZ59_08170 [Pectobacterium atrosepticum]POW30070.1 hypothetical protein PB72LOC_01766 [Pectobacterium atrosepticum]GKV85450.1 hypothetical protein PEC301296_17620 [Pectobacterium carotovorum subsp. carotovorum]
MLSAGLLTLGRPAVLVGFFPYAPYNLPQDYPVFYGTFRRSQTQIPILLGCLTTEAAQF